MEEELKNAKEILKKAESVQQKIKMQMTTDWDLLREEIRLLRESIKTYAEFVRVSQGEERKTALKKLKEIKICEAEIIKEANNLVKGFTFSDPVGFRMPPIAKKPNHALEDVVGNKNFVKMLQNEVENFDFTLQRNGKDAMAGYLFYAPKGSDEECIVEAFIHELMEQSSYTYLHESGQLLTESRRDILYIFDCAKRHQPCILRIDEVEKVCQDCKREGISELECNKTNLFLDKCLDLKETKVILIATTSNPQEVDSRFLSLAESEKEPLINYLINKDARKEKIEQYKTYMVHAKNCFEENNGEPSVQEFYYLTEAGKVCAEIVKVARCKGYEEAQKRLIDIKTRRAEIAQYLNPEGYEKLIQKYQTQMVKSWFTPKPAFGLADIADNKEFVSSLRSALQKYSPELRKFNEHLQLPKSSTYLFYGAPGTGVGYCARAFARELVDLGFCYMNGKGRLFYSGVEGEKNIKLLFETVREHAPCVLVLDEIEMVCANRSDSNQPCYARGMTPAFLSAYHNVRESDVVIIGVTNHPQKVDEYFVDHADLICVNTPDLESRMTYLQIKNDNLISLEDGFTYKEMAERTEGYTYKDINYLFQKLQQRVREEQYGGFVLTRELFEAVWSEFKPIFQSEEQEEITKFKERTL